MVLISSLYPVRDARSWPDKVHDAWMLLGLAPGWPLAWPLARPVQTGSGSNQFQFRPVLVQTGSGSDQFGSSGSGSILSLPDTFESHGAPLGARSHLGSCSRAPSCRAFHRCACRVGRRSCLSFLRFPPKCHGMCVGL